MLFRSSLAVAGEMFSREGWQHPPGNSTVAWVKHYRNSPIVYIQGGDDATAWNDPNYQRLLGNAIAWVASAGAHAWARERYQAEQQVQDQQRTRGVAGGHA